VSGETDLFLSVLQEGVEEKERKRKKKKRERKTTWPCFLLVYRTIRTMAQAGQVSTRPANKEEVSCVTVGCAGQLCVCSSNAS